MQIRACRMPADDTDLQSRLAAIRYLIADAASDGAEVILFPELAATGYGADDAIRDLAEEADGAIVSDTWGVADDRSITVAIGLALRERVLAGAEIMFVPTALPAGDASRFIVECVVPVRAFENPIFVVYVNRVGRDPLFAHQGRSCIAAPDGSRLAAAPENRDAMIDATVDREDYAASVERNPHLDELRAFDELRRPAGRVSEREDALWRN